MAVMVVMIMMVMRMRMRTGMKMTGLPISGLALFEITNSREIVCVGSGNLTWKVRSSLAQTAGSVSNLVVLGCFSRP